jgi:hypothetical protein
VSKEDALLSKKVSLEPLGNRFGRFQVRTVAGLRKATRDQDVGALEIDITDEQIGAALFLCAPKSAGAL